MAKTGTLSTSIDFDLKMALTLFCKQRGLKMQTVVENAIRERLEDEIDLTTYLKRKDEAEISLSGALKVLKK